MKKTSFGDIARHITGISTPVFGISWTPPETEREPVRRLMAFLEDRRALYYAYDMEAPYWVKNSVLEIRRELTKTLQALPETSEATPSLRAMRTACRKFLDETERPWGPNRQRPRHYSHNPESGFFAALGELRGVFGIHIAQLCVKYGIDLEDELASILPDADEGRESENEDQD